MKALLLGIFLLVVSGANVYLPNVGNLFDVWRIGFTLVTFVLGWALIIKSIADAYADQ